MLGDVDDAKDASDSENDEEFMGAESAESDDDEAAPKGKEDNSKHKSTLQQDVFSSDKPVTTPTKKLAQNRVNKITKQTRQPRQKKLLGSPDDEKAEAPGVKLSTPRKKGAVNGKQKILRGPPTPPASAKKYSQEQSMAQHLAQSQAQAIPFQHGRQTQGTSKADIHTRSRSRSRMGRSTPNSATWDTMEASNSLRELSCTTQIPTSPSSTQTSETLDRQ